MDSSVKVHRLQSTKKIKHEISEVCLCEICYWCKKNICLKVFDTYFPEMWINVADTLHEKHLFYCNYTSSMFFFPHVCLLICIWQASRRLWTCLCGNSLYFFNNAKDAHVSFTVYLLLYVFNTSHCADTKRYLCGPVCGEAGPQRVCVPQRWQQPRQKPGSGETHPPHERWGDQIHCMLLNKLVPLCAFFLSLKTSL